MNSAFIAYFFLGLAIICEVTGSTFLQKSQQFTKLAPTIITILFFIMSFFFLSQALKGIPLGIAYAIWAGLGIVLTAVISVLVFKFTLDMWAILGITLIIAGVIVMNTLSTSSVH